MKSEYDPSVQESNLHNKTKGPLIRADNQWTSHSSTKGVTASHQAETDCVAHY